MSRDEAAILDIVKACQLAIEFKGEVVKKDFLDDLKTQSAILHQLLLLGEATKRLSLEFRSTHPHVPWSKMTGMRDKLIHDYDEVDMDEVWKTVASDIPKLLTVLVPLVPQEKP